MMIHSRVVQDGRHNTQNRRLNFLIKHDIDTNDDGKDLIRKLSSSIIFDARQVEIQLKYS